MSLGTSHKFQNEIFQQQNQALILLYVQYFKNSLLEYQITCLISLHLKLVVNNCSENLINDLGSFKNSLN